MRWSDLDLQAGIARFPRVIVQGPGGVVIEQKARRQKRSGRKVTLDVYSIAALVALHDESFALAVSAGVVLPSDALVFSNDLDGRRPWTPNAISSRYISLRERLGLYDVRLHDLRHFMATTLLNAGVNPKTVATRGGWSQIATMLNRYAHSLQVSDLDAAQRIGDILANRPDDG